ncbi:hypothetical protein COLO4_12283 [Corchorus olitorius]|uniref:Uncharacterized protein n=1 Tax=Corchorus olitorius TaxID=93759 RepID=A0A1R3K1N8_9ROSI|nr:hypothetical protein COLO4_12283 [Corchorus olitorius]
MKSSRIDSPSSPRRRSGFGFSENHLPLTQISLPERNLDPPISHFSRSIRLTFGKNWKQDVKEAVEGRLMEALQVPR